MDFEQVRKRFLGTSSVNFDRIIPRLYQGSAPVSTDRLHEQGFHVLVLCAEEWQPPARDFMGLETVIHAPNDDSGKKITADQWRIAREAAKRVSTAVEKGKTVLVTCFAGRNRSGLVSALALHNLTGRSGRDCVARVRARRPNALTNEEFVRLLERIPAKMTTLAFSKSELRERI